MAIGERGQDFYQNLSTPHAIEAEQSVLGAVIIEPSCIQDLIQTLTPACFFKPLNGAIFGVMSQMFANSITIDIVSLIDACLQAGVFEQEKDAKMYLADLAQTVPSISNLKSYTDIVLDKYYLRSLIGAANEILETAGSNDATSAQLLDYAEQKIYDIRKGRDATGIRKIDQILVDAFDHLQKMSGPDRLDYAPESTGFGALDKVITGLNPSDLIVLAARPGVGKSSLAVNIATNMASRSKKDVVIFNLEMSAEQVVMRILSSESGIDVKRLHGGNIKSRDEWSSLARAAQTLSGMSLYVDDTPMITVPQMKAKLRKVKNLGLVVIDYLGLVQPLTKTESQVQRIGEITRHLKIMAKELNVPILVCAQLNRGPEGRPDKRPNLSDLRDSGSIEQDADVVLFIYRESYHDKNAEDKSSTELIVAKNRHGETNNIPLFWDGLHTRFTSLTGESEPD
ncbi:MAG: replicative DNA helicase [Oscillospiraceae bacterium]|nr:replicative DNA helicase [Oscillospiraceae bacterium]